MDADVIVILDSDDEAATNNRPSARTVPRRSLALRSSPWDSDFEDDSQPTGSTSEASVRSNATPTVRGRATGVVATSAEDLPEHPILCPATTSPKMQLAIQPEVQPTDQPTAQPTAQPTVQVTARPTVQATAPPIVQATAQPTVQATAQPTVQVKSAVKSKLTTQPARQPSEKPRPTAKPALQPDVLPVAHTVAAQIAGENTVARVNPTGKAMCAAGRPAEAGQRKSGSKRKTTQDDASAQRVKRTTYMPLVHDASSRQARATSSQPATPTSFGAHLRAHLERVNMPPTQNEQRERKIEVGRSTFDLRALFENITATTPENFTYAAPSGREASWVCEVVHSIVAARATTSSPWDRRVAGQSDAAGMVTEAPIAEEPQRAPTPSATRSAADTSAGCEGARGLEAAPWPHDIVHLQENYNPKGLIFHDMQHFGKCGCPKSCRHNTCQNGSLGLFCVEESCMYGGLCGNSLPPFPMLEIATRSDALGLCVRATRDIDVGTILGEYLGELRLVSPSAALREPNQGYDLYMTERAENAPWYRVCVDARRFGSILRFMNHLCAPSATFAGVSNGRKHTVVAVCTNKIICGEEVTVDYSWRDLWFKCLCREASCVHRDDDEETKGDE